MVSHCYSVWKKIHGVELEEGLADEDKEDEEEDELHDDLGTFGADEQLEVMCDELHDNIGGFMDDHIVLALLVVNFRKVVGQLWKTRRKHSCEIITRQRCEMTIVLISGMPPAMGAPSQR